MSHLHFNLVLFVLVSTMLGLPSRSDAQKDFTSLGLANPDRWMAVIYNKDLAHKLSLKFISQGILKIPHASMYAVELDALVGSTNGELATVYYYCKELDKSGLVLGFFNEVVNSFDYTQAGQWRGFKSLEEQDVLTIIENLEILEKKKEEAFGKGFDYLAYQYQDLTFVFYKDILWGKGHIHVYYGDFEASWTDNSFNKTLKRFQQSQKRVGK